MFDIKDYYRDHGRREGAGGNSFSTGEIETDITLDLENLLANRFDSLYKRERFKHHGHGIEIIYPRLSYPGNRSLLKGPDHLRNLLSLYPGKSDLENTQKIVLRPRYIEIGAIELMALYLRQRRILVVYLYHPHNYSLKNSKFSSYAEFYTEDLARHLGHRKNTGSDGTKDVDIPIPPLWYILSIISAGSEESIDKFFIRKKSQGNREISAQLHEISFYYSRHGY